jgi:hypothetical protein
MKAGVIAALLAAIVPLAFAGGDTDIPITPGPTVMSEQEKAIVADAASGLQHGVILIAETERDDNRGTSSELGHHLRAKILSPEGRGLADVAIPFEQGNSELKSWWGRTILPDGTVLELREQDLESQAVAKSVHGDFRELRGALPGVVPGCVIDYGYVIRQDGFSHSSRVFLQTEWPVRSFRYRWVPSRYMSAAYVASRAEGLAIDARADANSVLVNGRNLDPVPNEPQMPPLNEARASATFYYTTREKAAEYWELGAKGVETALKGFLRGHGAAREAVAAAGIPEGAALPDKLRLAYEWIGANVKNTNLLSAEEEEADDGGPNDAYSAKTVLKAKEGSPRQLDYLFAGMARELGAEANIVFAVDRTDRYWNKSLKTFGQFSYTFVAVRAPGAPDDAFVFVDAGSGMPFGQVPWRATGASALMCTAKGSVSILIPPSSPVINRADTHVTLAFSDENETMLAKWARTANGATGLEERRWLRDLDVRKRKETLDELCGASGRTEVSAAELPRLDEAAAPFQIGCDLELSDMNVGEDIGRYSLFLTGPWWPETPEFSSPTRVHPVIFDYPKLDILTMEIAAPHGFKPADAPAPVRLDSPYGRYQLSVTKTPSGFHVERGFALTVFIAKTPEYDAVRKYFADVSKADKTTVMFERDGTAK